MRLAIVTGGSRGLGEALFQQLNHLGYQLLDFSRSAPHKESHEVDLSMPLESHETIKRALADIDQSALEELLVINNASTNLPIGPLAAQDANAIVAHLNTNMVSQIMLLATIMAEFRETACRKVIANITSGAASHTFDGFSLYCASKAGMEQCIRTVAVEQQRESAPFVLINIDPGVVDTDMQAIVRQQSKADFPAVEQFIALKEEGNLQEPSETALAVIKILTSEDLVSGERYHVRDFQSAP